jgi:hypothetical protein
VAVLEGDIKVASSPGYWPTRAAAESVGNRSSLAPLMNVNQLFAVFKVNRCVPFSTRSTLLSLTPVASRLEVIS